MKNLKVSPLFLLCGPFLLMGCNIFPKVWHTETEDLVFPTEGIHALSVKTYNGKISVKASENSKDITVHVTKKAGGVDDLDAMACMKAIQIVTQVEGSIQKLGWDLMEPQQNHWQGEVDFEISIPPELSLHAQAYNGPVFSIGLNSEASIKTYNGRIEVKDHEGDLDLETHNGRIEVASVSDKIRCKSYNGKIHADLTGSPFPEGTMKTYNGSIRLLLGGEPSTRFQMKTRNGSIRTRKPMDVMYKDHTGMEGKLGEGEADLNLETYNGSITLE